MRTSNPHNEFGSYVVYKLLKLSFFFGRSISLNHKAKTRHSIRIPGPPLHRTIHSAFVHWVFPAATSKYFRCNSYKTSGFVAALTGRPSIPFSRSLRFNVSLSSSKRNSSDLEDHPRSFLYIRLYGPLTKLPFNCCAICFDSKVYTDFIEA